MTADAGLDQLWIVGPGRMGLALGKAIRSRGKGRNLTFLGRSPGGSHAAGVEALGARYVDLAEAGGLTPPEVILITVPDDAVEETAGRLASIDIPPGVALHTSGALASAALAPLALRGWSTGSMHPLVAVPDPEAGARKLTGAWFGIEGDDEAIASARAIVNLLGGRELLIGSDRKALYHAAAVMASNHVVALLDVAAGMMARCGVAPADAAAALGQLLRGALEDVSARGTRDALTGPIVRGDVQTVRAHLDRLSGEETRLYSVLAREALRIAAARGLSPAAVASIEATLAEELG